MGEKLSAVDPRPLEIFNDGALLSELHRRGRLKDVYSQEVFNYIEMNSLKDTGFLDCVKTNLAVRLGKHLFDTGFVKVEEHDDELHMRKCIRMRVLVVTVPQPSAG